MAGKGVITQVINASQFSRLCHTGSVHKEPQKILYLMAYAYTHIPSRTGDSSLRRLAHNSLAQTKTKTHEWPSES